MAQKTIKNEQQIADEIERERAQIARALEEVKSGSGYGSVFIKVYAGDVVEIEVSRRRRLKFEPLPPRTFTTE